MAFSLWEIIKYVSYKKLVLSKHLNKGIVEEIKYNVLSLSLIMFWLKTKFRSTKEEFFNEEEEKLFLVTFSSF